MKAPQCLPGSEDAVSASGQGFPTIVSGPCFLDFLPVTIFLIFPALLYLSLGFSASDITVDIMSRSKLGKGVSCAL